MTTSIQQERGGFTMATYSAATRNLEGFLAVKGEIAEAMEQAFYQKLQEMGEDAKHITWFYSIAEHRAPVVNLGRTFPRGKDSDGVNSYSLRSEKSSRSFA